MKKYMWITLFVVCLIFTYADEQTFTGETANTSDAAILTSGGNIPDILLENIPGITERNKFQKIQEYLKGDDFIDEGIKEKVLNSIKRTPSGETNPVHELINQRVELSSQVETISNYLNDILPTLPISVQLAIKPKERYENIVSGIENIDERLKTGLRSGEKDTLHSIAEFIATRSKGYQSDNLAPVVNYAKKHIISDGDEDAVNNDIGNLFDSFNKGAELISNMREADTVVVEADVDLRTVDALGTGMKRAVKFIKPLTSIGVTDREIDEDGHPVLDIIEYTQMMNREMPRALSAAKKNHLNLIVDLLNSEYPKGNPVIDNNGRSTSLGGRGFGEFLGVVVKVISIVSKILNNSEGILEGLGSFFEGLPGAIDVTSMTEAAGAAASALGVSEDLGGALSGGGSSSGAAASGDSKSGPVGGSVSGPGLSRIIQSANGAVNQSDVIYGIDCYTATTEYGNLACAAVVSAILQHAKANWNKQVLYCPTMENELVSKGYARKNYPSQGQFTAGDVVFWAKSRSGRARHVGVIVSKDTYGKWWAVDNSSSAKKVMKRPVIRSYYPVVKGVRTYGGN